MKDQVAMFYHPQDYKFVFPSCNKSEFIRCTAEYSHIDAAGQPVFKDCKGHFAVLRKNNWTKFDKKSLIRFMRGYFDRDEDFENWEILQKKITKKRGKKMFTETEKSQMQTLEFNNLSFDKADCNGFAWRDKNGIYPHEVIVLIGKENSRMAVIVFDAASVKFVQGKPLYFDSVDALIKSKTKLCAYVEKMYKKIWSK